MNSRIRKYLNEVFGVNTSDKVKEQHNNNLLEQFKKGSITMQELEDLSYKIK